MPVLSRVNMKKVMSGRQDLNLRPLDPQPSALLEFSPRQMLGCHTTAIQAKNEVII